MLQAEPQAEPLVQFIWNCFPFFYFVPEAMRLFLNFIFFIPDKFLMWPGLFWAIMMDLPSKIVWAWIWPFN